MTEVMPVIHFSKGQTIFAEEDISDEAYLIKDGRVEISTISENGKKVILANLGEKSVFGEMSFFAAPASRRSATATAMEETSCFIIKATFFESELEKLKPFMRGVIRNLVENIRNMNKKMP